mmetsp:Transcript_13334/g.15461  ORF Transcript_13334/g.15461 Transcript_13334/m.15461 type:complete len:85 (+) Transcript_13334:740-994(+)
MSPKKKSGMFKNNMNNFVIKTKLTPDVLQAKDLHKAENTSKYSNVADPDKSDNMKNSQGKSPVHYYKQAAERKFRIKDLHIYNF